MEQIDLRVNQREKRPENYLRTEELAELEVAGLAGVEGETGLAVLVEVATEAATAEALDLTTLLLTVLALLATAFLGLGCLRGQPQPLLGT